LTDVKECLQCDATSIYTSKPPYSGCGGERVINYNQGLLLMSLINLLYIIHCKMKFAILHLLLLSFILLYHFRIQKSLSCVANGVLVYAVSVYCLVRSLYFCHLVPCQILTSVPMVLLQNAHHRTDADPGYNQ